MAKIIFHFHSTIPTSISRSAISPCAVRDYHRNRSNAHQHLRFVPGWRLFPSRPPDQSPTSLLAWPSVKYNSRPAFFRAAFCLQNANRHRGSGHPLSPATPPYMRVRIRRFGGLRLGPYDPPMPPSPPKDGFVNRLHSLRFLHECDSSDRGLTFPL